MDNVLKFRKPLNKVFDKANEQCDQGDYLFALSSLLNEMENRPENAEICAHVADIYTELGLYENAILCWFKYLLRAKREDYWEAYNGLGANYYFLEDNYLASYYFSEQLKITEEVCGVYAEVLEEFLDEYGEEKKPKFKLVKEKTIEEKKQDFLNEIHRLCAEEQTEKALDMLKSVDRESSFYGESLLERALIYLRNDEISKAYEFVVGAINENYVTLLSISLAIDLSVALSTGEESRFLKLLEDYEPDGNEEKYKKMTALYEHGLEDSAIKIAVEMLKEDKFDANTSYVLGFLLFNKGDLKGAEKCFKTAYLLSGTYTSLYYLRMAQGVIDGKVEYKKIKVNFDVPIEESNEKIALINSMLSKDNPSYERPLAEMKDLIDWCVCSKEDKVTFLTCLAFIKTRRGDLFELVKEVMLNPIVSDTVKQSLLSVICAETKVKSVKLVVNGIFRNVVFSRPNFSPEYAEVFYEAYAKAVGKVLIFCDDTKRLLSIGAKELQNELISSGNIGLVTDTTALSCAMYVYSGLNVLKNKNFYSFFGTEKSKVIEIIKLTEQDNEN